MTFEEAVDLLLAIEKFEVLFFNNCSVWASWHAPRLIPLCALTLLHLTKNLQKTTGGGARTKKRTCYSVS